MKIVHVNFSDSVGGAAIAVKRFHDLLLKEGIDSHLVVCEKKINSNKIYSADNNLFSKIKIEIKCSNQVIFLYIFLVNDY